MHTNLKNFRNPKYIILSRISFWVTIMISFPLFFIDIYTKNFASGKLFIFFFYVYIAICNFVLGYRLNNPPIWTKWIMPKNWIIEWKFLSDADPDTMEIKTNHRKLIRVVTGSILLTIFLLATLSGKI